MENDKRVRGMDVSGSATMRVDEGPEYREEEEITVSRDPLGKCSWDNTIQVLCYCPKCMASQTNEVSMFYGEGMIQCEACGVSYLVDMNMYKGVGCYGVAPVDVAAKEDLNDPSKWGTPDVVTEKPVGFFEALDKLVDAHTVAVADATWGLYASPELPNVTPEEMGKEIINRADITRLAILQHVVDGMVK